MVLEQRHATDKGREATNSHNMTQICQTDFNTGMKAGQQKKVELAQQITLGQLDASSRC